MENTTTLLKTKKTAFTFQEVKDILKIPTDAGVKSFLQRAKANGALLNPIKGIRALPVYDKHELACKLKKQSYISLETVLYDAGAIFQSYFNTVTCVAPQTMTYYFENGQYTYSKIKDDILKNPLGIKTYDTYRIAMPERALCDYVYLYPHTMLDNPELFHKRDSLVRLRKFLPMYPKQTRAHMRRILKLTDKDI
jgi:hypothetical protein